MVEHKSWNIHSLRDSGGIAAWRLRLTFNTWFLVSERKKAAGNLELGSGIGKRPPALQWHPNQVQVMSRLPQCKSHAAAFVVMH